MLQLLHRTLTLREFFTVDCMIMFQMMSECHQQFPDKTLDIYVYAYVQHQKCHGCHETMIYDTLRTTFVRNWQLAVYRIK